MPTYAHFNEDGTCRHIARRKGDAREGEIEVPEGSNPNMLWFDGAEVHTSEKADATAIPTTVQAGAPVVIDLPPGTMAFVNGERSDKDGKLTLNTDGSAFHTVELRGSHSGSFGTSVQDYADRRREAYPPIEDQLDAFWKGDAELEAMRQRVLAVKKAHPKR